MDIKTGNAKDKLDAAMNGIIAALMIVVPTLPFSFPSSFRDCTVILLSLIHI